MAESALAQRTGCELADCFSGAGRFDSADRRGSRTYRSASNRDTAGCGADNSRHRSTAVQQPAVASTSSLLDSESAAFDERTQSLASAAIVPKRPAPMGPTLPSAASLQAQGINVPPLRLELHAYSDKPTERFVFINGRKYREGERLTEGPEVVRIEPSGVVLSEQGQRFQLAPE